MWTLGPLTIWSLVHGVWIVHVIMVFKICAPLIELRLNFVRETTGDFSGSRTNATRIFAFLKNSTLLKLKLNCWIYSM